MAAAVRIKNNASRGEEKEESCNKVVVNEPVAGYGSVIVIELSSHIYILVFLYLKGHVPPGS